MSYTRLAQSELLRKSMLDYNSPLEIPDKFKDGDDAQVDVTAPKSKKAQYLNQSFISMIANVGSNKSFDFPYSRRTGSNLQGSARSRARHETSDPTGMSARPSDKVTELDPRGSRYPDGKPRKYLVSSVPNLNERFGRDESPTLSGDEMSESQILPPRNGHQLSESQHSEHRDDLAHEVESRATLTEEEMIGREFPSSPPLGPDPVQEDDLSLPERLQLIFDFSDYEDLRIDFPCWFLQNLLLKGHMYVTERHVCFYAYLHKEEDLVTKSGFVLKRGSQNPKFNRYWFTLKDNVLAYHSDPSNLYFPRDAIDLRSAVSAELDNPNSPKDTRDFRVISDGRIFNLRAESASSAKEWTKQIQKAIFHAHNDSNTVKMSMPMQNILDVEESPCLDFADTFMIRIIDNDETFAVDEYFFSSIDQNQAILHQLRRLVKDCSLQGVKKHLKDHRECSAAPVDQESAQNSKVSRQTDYVQNRDQKHTNNQALHQGSVSKGLALEDNMYRASSDVTAVGSTSRTSGSIESDDVPADDLNSDFQNEPPFKRTLSENHDEETSPRSSSPPDEEAQSSSDASRIPGPHMVTASQILARSDVFHRPMTQDSYRNAHQSDNGNGNTTKYYSLQPDDEEQKSHPKTSDEKLMEGGTASNSRPGSHESLRHASQLGSLETLSSTKLKDLRRVSAFHLQRASGIASAFRDQSKRMSNALAEGSKGYLEKVTGMWAGKRMHFDGSHNINDSGQIQEFDDEAPHGNHGARFRNHFVLPETERLQATYHGYLSRVIPVFGKIYVGLTKLCFRSLLPGTRTKMILPLADIENIDKENGFSFGYSGLVIVVRGHEELFFEFSNADARDDLAITMLQALEAAKDLEEPKIISQAEKLSVEAAKAEHEVLQRATRNKPMDGDLLLKSIALNDEHESLPIVFDDPLASMIDFRLREPKSIICLTIGSRGDVQPFISLCKGFLEEGHRPIIATHAEFEPWIRHYGIDFRPVAGDPTEIMRLCVENDMFTVSFIREAFSKYRGWIDQLLRSSWKACQNTDILIESPSAMAGIHIAEAMQIPYFRAFTMPWTRTRAYPHAFAVPNKKLGGNYNSLTYVMFDNLFWKGIQGQVNRWRTDVLGLPSTTLEKLEPNKVPFLYNYSPSVVPQPLDFNHWIQVTGYWFLDEGADYEPPEELVDFIQKARDAQKKIVYVGFGSIVVEDPAALTRTVVDSILKADVHCILSKGWSERLEDLGPTAPETPLPPSIFQIKSAPHDWLFAQIDAVAHHGGAGTTGSSLRAGIPTIVKPFFGDQFFFGSRVEDLGVGRCLKKINTSVFSRALWEVTNSERMIVKAKLLGERIRKENGVDVAIQSIYRNLDYAHSLVQKRSHHRRKTHTDESVESWTMIEDTEEAELGGARSSKSSYREPQSPRQQSLPDQLTQEGTNNGSSGSSST